MRIGPVLLLLLVAAGLPAVRAGAYIETHLNEITEPVATASAGRVADLEAQGGLTKAEKKERRLLAKIVKKTSKTAQKLRNDFSELKAVGTAAKSLGVAVVSVQTELDETFGLAELALGERRELVDDHFALLTDTKQRTKVTKLIDKYAAARGAAGAASDPKTRAKQLAKAEASLTRALKKAEKYAQEVVAGSAGTLTMPPVRLRSGDQVGSGGARVAVPADSGADLARTSVVIPPGALAALTRITIQSADDIVGGRDEATGPAVRFLPAGQSFNQPVRVALPYTLPPGADAGDLAMFRSDGIDTDATLDVVIEPNATVSAPYTSFAEFQPGLLAPPEGAPDGTYRTKMFVVLHTLDDANLDESSQRVEMFEQELTFRPDNSGSAAFGAVPLVARQFLSASPHNVTTFTTAAIGSFDFDWTAIEPGAFSFDFPPAGLGVVAQGIVSTDGNLVSYTGHTDQFDFLAVGVRITTGATLADLDGRWFAVRLGAQFLDAGAQPFRTRWTAAYSGFDLDASTGDLTYHTDGEVFESDVTYNTNLTTPTHTVGHTVAPDGGGLTLVALPDGAVRSADLRFLGQASPDSGALIATDLDLQAHRISLLVAVKQPTTVPAATLDGDYHWTHLDLAPRESVPQGTTSHLDIDTATGIFSASTGTSATLTLGQVTRATYTFTGLPPLANMTWTSSDAVQMLTPAPAGITLELDAAGNHRDDMTERYFGVSGDGDIVLSVAPGEAGRVLRGVGIGLK